MPIVKVQVKFRLFQFYFYTVFSILKEIRADFPQSKCAHVSSIVTRYNVGSVLWRLFSTSGNNISTVGDNFSTVEVAQYSGGIASVLWG